MDGLLFETRPRVSGWRLSLEVEGFSWVAIQLGVGQGSVGWQSSLEVEVFSWVEMATQAAGLQGVSKKTLFKRLAPKKVVSRAAS